MQKYTRVPNNRESDTIYSSRPNLYLGFHGCEKSIGFKLLTEPNDIKISQNSYEWLGHGFYVWENNPERALDWAKQHRKIKDPFVIGIAYTLGTCLDLTDKHFIDLLSKEYQAFELDMQNAGESLPENEDLPFDSAKDELLRKLDCAVIQHMHYVNELNNNGNVYDTVRGAFSEGLPAYKGAKIYSKTHIQVCIRNMACIKGFFLPR